MTICFFGIYDPKYARNRVLIDGLRANGVTIVECRVDPKHHSRIGMLWQLVVQARTLDRQAIDRVLVAFPGQQVVWLARLLFRKPIIFDAFLSLYDSNVFDRKTHKKGSIKAGLDWFWDWFGCLCAETILLDTDAHIDYFAHTFGVPKKKCIRVWIGADDRTFYPRNAALSDEFTVEFHGSFIPLQGVEYIIDAAEIIAHVRFSIVGAGQEFARINKTVEEKKLTNVTFVGKVPTEEVPLHIAGAHVCLGIFGNTAKTQRVIPNKVYECIAMGMPVITADTPAMREIFEDHEQVLLCKASDGAALARAIEELECDPALRERIAAGGRQLFESTFAPKCLGAELLHHLHESTIS